MFKCRCFFCVVFLLCVSSVLVFLLCCFFCVALILLFQVGFQYVQYGQRLCDLGLNISSASACDQLCALVFLHDLMLELCALVFFSTFLGTWPNAGVEEFPGYHRIRSQLFSTILPTILHHTPHPGKRYADTLFRCACQLLMRPESPERITDIHYFQTHCAFPLGFKQWTGV